MNPWAKLKNWFAGLKAKWEGAQSWSPNRSHVPTSKPEPRFDVTASVRTIIAAKAYYFECNNAIAQRLGSVFVDYTVGANGLMLTPGSSDSTWNAAAKKYWAAAEQFLNLKTRHPFGIDQGLIAWRWFFDGEIFILKTRGQANSGRWFPRIQLIEAEYVCTPPSLAAEEGKTVIDGIAIDPNGRPTGYWIKELADPARGLVNFRLVEAANIIHVFEPTRPGQMRGISFLAPVINDLHDLDDLQILEGQAAKQNAKVSRFIETATGEFNAEDARRIPGTGGTADSVDGKKRFEHYQETLGAEYQALFAGDKVHQFPGERPSETSREYWNYLTSKICYGIGIPKVVAFSDWMSSAQGTVVRGDYDIAAVFFRTRSSVLQAAFREIYLYVIGWGIRTEATLNDPLPPDWFALTIRPPRAVNVDVGRNSAAQLAELAVGATNYELIYSPLGLDARDEITKGIEFVAYIKKQCAAISAREGVEVTPAEFTEQAAAVLASRNQQLADESNRQREEDIPITTSK